jgi:hypothetical protein
MKISFWICLMWGSLFILIILGLIFDRNVAIFLGAVAVALMPVSDLTLLENIRKLLRKIKGGAL